MCIQIEGAIRQVTGDSGQTTYGPEGIMPFPLDEFHIACKETKFGVRFSQ